jgi:hypothetical protein
MALHAVVRTREQWLLEVTTEEVMKRTMVAVLAIAAVAVGAGWNISSHPESSTELADISLEQRSERSHTGHSDALTRVRVRVSPSDLGVETRATADEVPRIALVAE